MNRLAAQELSAYLIVGFTFFFEENNLASSCGQAHRQHRAGEAAANHEIFYGVAHSVAPLGACDTQPRWREAFDHDIVVEQPGGSAHSAPVFRNEGASN